MAVEDLIRTVMEELKSLTQTDVYMGKPIQAGTAIVIPVSKVSLGFGAGGGGLEGDKAQGRGTGGGLMIEPVAFLVIQDNETHLLSLKQPGSPTGKLIELIPDVIAQVKKAWEHRRQEGTAEESKESGQ